LIFKYVLAAAVVVGFAGADKNQHCRVVEKNVVGEDALGMQVGKQAYPSFEEANIDLKVVCENP
jgi:hypothetical protein